MIIRQLIRSGFSTILVGVTMATGFIIGHDTGVVNDTASTSEWMTVEDDETQVIVADTMQQETIPPSTPLPTLTPFSTLRPPPTFEPPTPTPTPSQLPTETPPSTAEITVDIPGLNGLSTPTPESTPHCEPRSDWTLTYTVQRDDALDTIAVKYGTYSDVLAEGNCLPDKNLIRIGQVLHVPGDAPPNQSSVQCVPFEALTPANGSTIPSTGLITFNWRGPLAPKNLLRIMRPDGSVYEETIEFRQNQQISAAEHMTQVGTYSWWIFPMDEVGNTVIECPMGGPWAFNRASDN